MPYISATAEIMYAPCFFRLATANLFPQFLAWVFGLDLLQLLPELARFQVARRRHHDLHFHDLVAAFRFVRRGGDTFVPEAQFLSGWSSRRNAELRASVNGGDFYLG